MDEKKLFLMTFHNSLSGEYVVFGGNSLAATYETLNTDTMEWTLFPLMADKFERRSAVILPCD
jgi:hypothetical protein